MICRPDPRLPLLALALAIVGCSVAVDGSATSTVNPDIAVLLDEAQSLMVDGALADAGQKLDEARELAPDDPDLWVAIARLRYRGGEHLTALEAADRALAVGPDHAPALLMRALFVRDAHGLAASLPWFEAALAADPENREAWAEYAATLGDGGAGEDALNAVRELFKVAPEDPRVFYFQAVIAARAGNWPLARSLLSRSGMAVRGVPAAVLLDAVISLEVGNSDSAAATLEQLAARQPANSRLKELHAKALLQSGRASEVIDGFSADAARQGASPYLVMLVARAHERMGDRASAAPLLARASGGTQGKLEALTARPGLTELTTAMRGLAASGDWAGANADAQGLRVRFPASADVAILAGDAALGAGDPRGALETYALAARVKRPWTLTRKAVLAYRQANDELAADTLLARHVAGEPNAISPLLALAQRQAEQGDWRRAALLLDQAIRLGGGHDPALLTLRIEAARSLGEAEDVRRFSALLAQLRPRLMIRS